VDAAVSLDFEQCPPGPGYGPDNYTPFFEAFAAESDGVSARRE
jgi:hypothetical protein